MASVQQQAPVAQNDEHNATVEEMTKEAQSLLTKSINDGAVKRQACLVAGVMMNKATFPMKLEQTHDYDGKFVVKPSPTIERGQPGMFVHQGYLIGTDFPNGNTKGAVVYTEYIEGTGIGLPMKSYLLAWDVPNSKLPVHPKNRVYVECGLEGKFANVDWAEIDRKLKASSCISECFDPITRAFAIAKIDGEGNEAKLGAAFTIKK